MARLPINHLMLLCLGVVYLLVIQASAVSYGIDEAKATEISPKLLSINGTVFNDLNANGFVDESEPGLPGWTVRLMQDDTEVLNATSNDSGRYIFEGLNPGRYVVAQDLMPGWNQTAPGGGVYNITLVDKDGHRYDFGNFEGEFLALDAVEYPLMRPTIEELQRWIEAYKTAPLAGIDQDIEKMLEISPTGSLSLLNHLQYIPAERDQWDCGNCWVWAGTGVMEIGLSVEEGIKDRLSIQYLNSNYLGGSGSDWACCGHWLADLANFYAGTGKAIPWSNANAHWQDQGRTCEMGSTSVPAGLITTTPNYPIDTIEAQAILTQGVGSATAISNIKNVLNQNKAVTFLFFLPTYDEWNIFVPFWLNQPESALYNPTFQDGKSWNNEQGAGHAVLCVGYNDNDPNNKYWIMLNSWGTTAGRPNGLFRVNMNMNYDNYFTYDGEGYYAFYWETLDLEYDLPLEEDSIGVFRPSAGTFFLDMTKNGWTPNDKAIPFGLSEDQPAAGDWNGDGKDTIGIFRPSAGTFYLDMTNNGWTADDVAVPFGISGDLPVAGNWKVDGKDTIGVFRPRPSAGTFYLDMTNDGWTADDIAVPFGISGDLPVAGDWNGDGKDTIGVFRPSAGTFYLDMTNDGWTGDDKAIPFGLMRDLPIVGDWNGDGKDTIGVFRPSAGTFFLDLTNNGWTPDDLSIPFGISGDRPVAGNWL